MSFRLGMKTIVVASSPAMAKEVLKTRVMETAKLFSHHKLSLLWGQFGPLWRYLRRISTVELFSPQILEARQHLRRQQIFHTVRLIFESKGKPVIFSIWRSAT
ncbi:hypothetical protein SUGI_0938510 [Cryptomeria japonica]|nr:hypothetical protein SUGI_0938510 [Cryptomeria japonica]